MINNLALNNNVAYSEGILSLFVYTHVGFERIFKGLTGRGKNHRLGNTAVVTIYICIYNVVCMYAY